MDVMAGVHYVEQIPRQIRTDYSTWLVEFAVGDDDSDS